MSIKVLGYHGTSSDRLPSIINNGFRASARPASWLGYGVYFFYHAPGHASSWARNVTSRRAGKGVAARPVSIEVEIRLGNCLNLLDNVHWPTVKTAYANIPPSISQVSFYNSAAASGMGFNYRDCAALNAVTAAYNLMGTPLDTIMAAFPEGKPIDPTSWLFDEAAVTVCVLQPAVIRIIGHRFV